MDDRQRIERAHSELKMYVTEARQIEANDTLDLFNGLLHSDPGFIGVSLDNGMPYISYPRKPEDTFDSSRRVKVKVRRYLGKIFNTSESDVNRAGELLCSVSAPSTTFDVIDGD